MESRRSPIVARFEGVLDRLRASRPALPKTAARIADYFLDHPGEVVQLSVTSIADRTRSSEGSVVALCQLIGASGFHQVKVALANELARASNRPDEPPAPGDDVATIADKVFRIGQQALALTHSGLEIGALEDAVRAMREAERVEIFGSGSSGPIAQHAHYRMARIGLDARVSTDSHMQIIAASLADARAAVLAISHSGTTVETVAATRLAKEAGATTIVVTNVGRPPIAAYADIVLHTFASEAPFHSEAMTTRLAQVAVVDTLIACLAFADYAKSRTAIEKTFESLSANHI